MVGYARLAHIYCYCSGLCYYLIHKNNYTIIISVNVKKRAAELLTSVAILSLTIRGFSYLLIKQKRAYPSFFNGLNLIYHFQILTHLSPIEAYLSPKKPSVILFNTIICGGRALVVMNPNSHTCRTQVLAHDQPMSSHVQWTHVFFNQIVLNRTFHLSNYSCFFHCLSLLPW